MAELAAGSSSRWAPYLVRSCVGPEFSGLSQHFVQAALPRHDELHVPVLWSAGETGQLRGTACELRLGGGGGSGDELPSDTRTAWQTVVAPLAAREPRLRLAGERAHAHATALVAAYSFTLGQARIQAMVPFWDALNHVHPERASVRLHHRADAGRLDMVVVRAVARGEQVFNSYGPLGTSELVRRYGFAAPEGNPHDSVDVTAAELLAAARHVMGSRAQVQLAHSCRLAGDGDGTLFRLPRSGVPPPAMVLAMRVLCAGGAEGGAAARSLRRGLQPPPMAPADAAALDARVADAFQWLARSAQRQRSRDAEARQHAPGAAASAVHRHSLAARVRDSECRCFATLAENSARGVHLRVDSRTAAALWRRCIRKASFRHVVAARAKCPRPPDLTSPRVLRKLCLAGLVRFKPPPSKSAAPGQRGQRRALPPCCISGACGARCSVRGPFTMHAG